MVKVVKSVQLYYTNSLLCRENKRNPVHAVIMNKYVRDRWSPAESKLMFSGNSFNHYKCTLCFSLTVREYGDHVMKSHVAASLCPSIFTVIQLERYNTLKQGWGNCFYYFAI